MSESETMFNEQVRRCAAVQLMLSTNPSYENRTIASTLKMQIWIATNHRNMPRVMKTKVSGYGYGLWCSGFKWGPHHASSHLRNQLESQHQNVPGWVEECGDPLVQSGWPVADPGCGSRIQHQSTSPKRPRLGFRRSATTLYPSLTAPYSHDLNPLDSFIWSYVENIINMTSHNTKACLIATIRWVFTELPLALVEKACSQFRIRIEVVIEAEGGYIE